MTEKVVLGKPSALLGGRTVGEFPFGIPVNIQITGESLQTKCTAVCLNV